MRRRVSMRAFGGSGGDEERGGGGVWCWVGGHRDLTREIRRKRQRGIRDSGTAIRPLFSSNNDSRVGLK